MKIEVLDIRGRSDGLGWLERLMVVESDEVKTEKYFGRDESCGAIVRSTKFTFAGWSQYVSGPNIREKEELSIDKITLSLSPYLLWFCITLGGRHTFVKLLRNALGIICHRHLRGNQVERFLNVCT